MSRYAHIACHDCRWFMWLGKVIFRNSRPFFFHVGPETAPLNSSDPVRTRAMWKFLADHANHAIGVYTEGAPQYDEALEYNEIGGDCDGDISLDEYLKDWEG